MNKVGTHLSYRGGWSSLLVVVVESLSNLVLIASGCLHLLDHLCSSVFFNDTDVAGPGEKKNCFLDTVLTGFWCSVSWRREYFKLNKSIPSILNEWKKRTLVCLSIHNTLDKETATYSRQNVCVLRYAKNSVVNDKASFLEYLGRACVQRVAEKLISKELEDSVSSSDAVKSYSFHIFSRKHLEHYSYDQWWFSRNFMEVNATTDFVLNSVAFTIKSLRLELQCFQCGLFQMNSKSLQCLYASH